VRAEMAKQRRELDDINSDHSSRINSNMDNIKRHREVLAVVNDTIKKIKDFQEGLSQNLIKTMSK
jgi:hypothetical protein